MKPTEMFKLLKAPLANARWSWGAVRSDGVVFLRVWQDKVRIQDGRRVVQITHNDRHGHETGNRGHIERNKQVELVRGGAPCYLVMCEAKDVNDIPRQIKNVDSQSVFATGELQYRDGDWWIEMLERRPVTEVMRA